MINRYQTGEDLEKICIPGCGACCFYISDRGIHVRKSEAELVAKKYGPLVYDDERARRLNEGGSKRKQKNPIVAFLPSKEGNHSKFFKEYYHDFFFDDGQSLDSHFSDACLFTSNVNLEDNAAILSIDEWSVLVDIFGGILKTELDVKYPVEGFEGVMCNRYGDERPKICKTQTCSYSGKIMPKLIRNHGADIVEQMLNEPTLAKRFLLASDWLYKPKSL